MGVKDPEDSWHLWEWSANQFSPSPTVVRSTLQEAALRLWGGFLKDSIENSTLVSQKIKPSHTVSSQKLLQSSRSKVSFEYNSLWPLTEYLECFQNPCRFGSQYQKGWFHSEKPPEPPQKQRGVWLLKHKPGPTKDFQGLKRNKTTKYKVNQIALSAQPHTVSRPRKCEQQLAMSTGTLSGVREMSSELEGLLCG